MVNFKEKLFPKSKDDSKSKKRDHKDDSRPPSSSRSYSSTKSFSILGRQNSPSPTASSPSPTFTEQQLLRTRNVSGASTNSGTSLIKSRSRSPARSASLVQARSSPSPSGQPGRATTPIQVWSWKIQEPTLREDEVDYSEYLECFGCKKPIYKDMVQLEALEKLWHPECFHCSCCAKVLSPPEKFMELKGKPYCERDYNELFFPKCYACTKSIFENEVVVLQKSYHPGCFTCRKCSRPLCPYTKNFLERHGSFYCTDDYHDLFSPKCYECEQPIRDQKNMTRALGTTYHREHFTCFECKNPLPGNNIWKKDGQFYCEDDYHKLFSPLCAGCFEPIRHNGIAAIGKNWHDDCCLRCGACQKILKLDNYIQHEDKAYCRNDWIKLFGPKCADCRKPIFETLRGEGVIAMGLDFHPGCFRCYECLTVLDENTYYEFMGRPYCHEHYHGRTCVDCIKKADQIKILRQESMDQMFEHQIYGGHKKVKGGNAATAKSGSGSAGVGGERGLKQSQSSLRSRSISPLDYVFRSKSTPA